MISFFKIIVTPKFFKEHQLILLTEKHIYVYKFLLMSTKINCLGIYDIKYVIYSISLRIYTPYLNNNSNESFDQKEKKLSIKKQLVKLHCVHLNVTLLLITISMFFLTLRLRNRFCRTKIILLYV